MGKALLGPGMKERRLDLYFKVQLDIPQLNILAIDSSVSCTVTI
jgi:hypothetical protein